MENFPLPIFSGSVIHPNWWRKRIFMLSDFQSRFHSLLYFLLNKLRKRFISLLEQNFMSSQIRRRCEKMYERALIHWLEFFWWTQQDLLDYILVQHKFDCLIVLDWGRLELKVKKTLNILTCEIKREKEGLTRVKIMSKIIIFISCKRSRHTFVKAMLTIYSEFHR